MEINNQKLYYDLKGVSNNELNSIANCLDCKIGLIIKVNEDLGNNHFITHWKCPRCFKVFIEVLK